MTDKKAARLRVGNDAVFTRVGARSARVTPTPDQFPSDEIPFETPAAKGALERENRTDAELLEDPEEELLAGSDLPSAPKRPLMARDPAAAATRNVGSRSSPADFELPDLDDLLETPTRTETRDPARLVVLRMIARALASSGLTLRAAGRDGTVTLLTLPAACWTGLARDAWRDVARGGEKYRDGGLDRDWHGG